MVFTRILFNLINRQSWHSDGWEYFTYTYYTNIWVMGWTRAVISCYMAQWSSDGVLRNVPRVQFSHGTNDLKACIPLLRMWVFEHVKICVCTHPWFSRREATFFKKQRNIYVGYGVLSFLLSLFLLYKTTVSLFFLILRNAVKHVSCYSAIIKEVLNIIFKS